MRRNLFVVDPRQSFTADPPWAQMRGTRNKWEEAIETEKSTEILASPTWPASSCGSVYSAGWGAALTVLAKLSESQACAHPPKEFGILCLCCVTAEFKSTPNPCRCPPDFTKQIFRMLLETSPLKMMVSKIFGEYGSAVHHTLGPTHKAMLSHHDNSQYTNPNPGILPKPGSVLWWLRCETGSVVIIMRTVSPSDHCLNKQSYFPQEAGAQV